MPADVDRKHLPIITLLTWETAFYFVFLFFENVLQLRLSLNSWSSWSLPLSAEIMHKHHHAPLPPTPPPATSAEWVSSKISQVSKDGRRLIDAFSTCLWQCLQTPLLHRVYTNPGVFSNDQRKDSDMISLLGSCMVGRLPQAHIILFCPNIGVES